MGYRSDVAFRIEVNPDKLNAFQMFEELLKNLDDVDLTLDCSQHILEKDTITLVWFQTKWYESYSDVRIVEEWFQKYVDLIDEYDWRDKNRPVYGAQKIEIGEDLEDCHERYYGDLHNSMYINREIEF